MPKATKRERQRLNRDARREAMLAEEKKRKRMRTIRNLAFLLIPLVILFVVLQVTKSDDSSKSSSDKQTSLKAPAQTIDPTASYTATMDTSEGTMVFALDAAKYPKSVNNFVYLADKKFYDGLLFNRVAKDFVIQAGSPDNTTAGGPGYTVQGEVPTGTPPYPVGSLAMAKSGSEPAGTAGSQFFIVTGSGADSLKADYASVGSITEGLDVAQKIGQLYPASGDGKPTKQVTIKKITISSTAPTTTSAP